MAAEVPKPRNISWNVGDDVKLLGLFDKGLVDPRNDLSEPSLTPIRLKYFSHLTSVRNFRERFKEKAANYIVTGTIKQAGSKMPKKSVTEQKLAAAAEQASSPTGGSDIANQFSSLQVDKLKMYSFNKVEPFTTKGPYMKSKNDVVEVEFITASTQDLESSVQVELVSDGNQVKAEFSTPQMFGEEKRMKVQMGDTWSKKNPRVMAHADLVQDIRVNNKAVHKKFWGDQPQIVDLPVKCEGEPTKAFRYIPSGKTVDVPMEREVEEVDAAGVRNVRMEQYIEHHMQFHAVLTYQFKVAKKRVGRTKAARATVTQALSEDSEESDVDEDEDEDDMAM